MFNNQFLVHTILSFLSFDNVAKIHRVNTVTANCFYDIVDYNEACILYRRGHGSLLVRDTSSADIDDFDELPPSAIDGREVYTVDKICGQLDGIVMFHGCRMLVLHEGILKTFYLEQSRLGKFGVSYQSQSIWSLIMTLENGWAALDGDNLYFSNFHGVVYRMHVPQTVTALNNSVIDATPYASDDYVEESEYERDITGFEVTFKKMKIQ